MEFSWTIAVVALLVNWFVMGLMFLLQQCDRNMPERHSIIPGTRQKFLYFQDFWTMTWGDAVGVGLIQVAFWHLAYSSFNTLLWPGYGLAVFAFMVQFARMCLSDNHKPDMGFPEIGEISAIGKLHLLYYGMSMAAGLSCVIAIVSGHLRGIPLWIGLAGGAFYALCFVLEIKSGNFDPLKLEGEPADEPNPISLTPCESCPRRENCPGPC